MLSCFTGSTNKIFQHILRFYLRKRKTINTVIDITYGEGHSWKDLERPYEIIKVDRVETGDDIITADFNDYLPTMEDERVDGIYYDPPYYLADHQRTQLLLKPLRTGLGAFGAPVYLLLAHRTIELRFELQHHVGEFVLQPMDLTESLDETEHWHCMSPPFLVGIKIGEYQDKPDIPLTETIPRIT